MKPAGGDEEHLAGQLVELDRGRCGEVGIRPRVRVVCIYGAGSIIKPSVRIKAPAGVSEPRLPTGPGRREEAQSQAISRPGATAVGISHWTVVSAEMVSATTARVEVESTASARSEIKCAPPKVHSSPSCSYLATSGGKRVHVCVCV